MLAAFIESVIACCRENILVKAVNPFRLKLYYANGRAFIVQEHLTAVDGVVDGFEVFVPASSENNVAATLGAARNFIASGNVAPSALACCEELIRGDGSPDSQQRAIDHARRALGLAV